MKGSSSDVPTSIIHLPDDCISRIFQSLKSCTDRESFGLTCRSWLHIQNISRRSLQFHCSFQVMLSSLSRPDINSLHLSRLLNRFQHLQSLSLSGCTELPDSALSHLQHHGSEIEDINLDCCFGITEVGLRLVATSCPSLTVISLYRCFVKDTGLEILARSCPGLKDVNLSFCSLISDFGIRSLSQHCSLLRAVKMTSCRQVKGTGFKGCSRNLAYLEADSCKLEPEGIMDVISGGGLLYINLSNNISSIYGGSLAAIGEGFALRLKFLNLRMCRNVGDESIIAISNGCPLLREWNLASCHGVRLGGWESIGLNCCNLEILHVNRCRNLCDNGLQALRDGCKKLVVLYLGHCCRLSFVATELFRLYRSGVKVTDEEIMSIGPSWAFR